MYRLTCLVSPLHESSGLGNAVPPCGPWTDTPARISWEPLHSERSEKYFNYLPKGLSSQIQNDFQGRWCWKHSLDVKNVCGSHLAEALQNIFHLLITSEEVGQGLFHRVEVSQGLVLLHDQLLDGVVGERLLFLVILWWTHTYIYTVDQILSLCTEESAVVGTCTV